MIFIGTSGYSYDDWVGPVYPEGTKKTEYLEHYVQWFDTNELNFTYYRMPSAKMLGNFVDKVPDGFLWTVKAPKEITHEREDPIPNVEKFVDALAPLKEAGQFACTLLQFPSSFRAAGESNEDLKREGGALGGAREVDECENREWVTEDTFDQVHDNGLG